jgi:hypothetical protein|eukprot:COSAG06_NODE_354_length_16880_cov_7.746545_2_plen_88_part_00
MYRCRFRVAQCKIVSWGRASISAGEALPRREAASRDMVVRGERQATWRRHLRQWRAPAASSDGIRVTGERSSRPAASAAASASGEWW